MSTSASAPEGAHDIAHQGAHKGAHRSAPLHLRVVGWLFLAWSVLAVTDDVMSIAMGDAYYKASGMTVAQMAYFSSLPWWVDASTSASVWGGLLGALALILRRRQAAPLFVISALGTWLYVLYTYFLSDGIAAMGMLWFMPALVGVLTVAVAGYTLRLARQGLLR